MATKQQTAKVDEFLKSIISTLEKKSNDTVMQLKVRMKKVAMPAGYVYPPLPSSFHYSSPVGPGLYGFLYYGQYLDMPVHQMPQVPRLYGTCRGTG